MAQYRKYLTEVDNLPSRIVEWLGYPVPALRKMVGSSDAPVYQMTKAQLVAHLAGQFLEDNELGETEETNGPT